MQNFIFISPNFPETYDKFVIALKNRGFRVLGIGDAPYNELKESLKNSLTEYYCIFNNMENIENLKTAVRYFENKYGHIDYLESNNEYWLIHDAILREEFHIDTGLKPQDMEKIKKKSAMKECFKSASIPVARYTIVSTLENSLNFVKEVHYPVFVKPNIGVGAADSYSIKNEEELISFHQKKLNEEYIMEEFIDGEIVSFDGIADDNSNVVIAFNEHFPVPVADVVNENLDDFYYALTNIEKSFYEMGVRTIKSFGIKKRCFHIEYFKLNKDHEGLGKKGTIVALECNMRPPGGYTPDLLSIALNASFYEVYGDVMMYNENRQDLTKEQYIAITASRKDIYSYFYSEEEILQKYSPSIVEHGRYPKSIALAMGDLYYYGRFKDIETALEFEKFVTKKK